MKLLIYTLFLSSFLFGNTHLLNKINKYEEIFKKYEKIYQIPSTLMKAVVLTENSDLDPDIVRKNSNNTYDIGLMQINTAWKKWRPDLKITKEKLKDPDFNIKIAYIIMRSVVDRHGYSWNAIGRYHSGTPSFKRKWIKRAKRNMVLLAKIDKNIKMVNN